MPEADIQFLPLGDAWRQDERGAVYFPWQNLPDAFPLADMCRNCHLISIVPGQIRGQHQHPDKTEWLLVFHGQGQLFWRSGDGELHQRLLSDNRTLVVIPPGMPHTLRNDGSTILYLLAWRAALKPGRDGADTVYEPLI